MLLFKLVVASSPFEYRDEECAYTKLISHEVARKLPLRRAYIFSFMLVHCSIMSDSGTLWTIVHPAPGSTGILQARILEWVAMPSSRGSYRPRNQTRIS